MIRALVVFLAVCALAGVAAAVLIVGLFSAITRVLP